MLNKSLKWLAVSFVAVAAVFTALLFVPKSNGKTYRIKVEKSQDIFTVSRELIENGVVFNRYATVATTYLTGAHNDLRTGSYRLPVEISAWNISKKLRSGRPGSVTVCIAEGMRFADMCYVISGMGNTGHETCGWSNARLMQTVAPEAAGMSPGGLLFLNTYKTDTGSSNVQIHKSAYQAIQDRLRDAWEGRQDGLPYKTPCEMSIMASLIKKETARKDGRTHMASAFVNHAEAGMRLQTDSTVIYGVGDTCRGKTRKADLRRDMSYNTYTRDGLSPTPIVLPSKAALEMAAYPSAEKYLYFVFKMDGADLSQFSHMLNEHNAAARKYTLKK